MILGVGVDIVEVPRIRRAVERYGARFVRRIFTEQESEYCRRCTHPEQRFATRFAAKEAALKALGVGWQKGVRFLEVEVSNDELGAPTIAFSGRALELSRKLGVERIHVSLSHHRDFAIAQVLLEDGAA
ncbi:MAG: holo-ACP synthase [Candidatus Brocadiaceae bacterium]|jgi:holo-[acyl-carrier protein] synthase